MHRVRWVNLTELNLRSCDDAIALNANEGEFSGPIEDVSISNVNVGGASALSIRSTNQRIDRIVVNGLTGQSSDRVLVITPFGEDGRGNGDVREVSISNVNVDTTKATNGDPGVGVAGLSLNGNIKSLSLKNFTIRPNDNRPIVWVRNNANIENLDIDLSIDDPSVQSIPIRVDGGTVQRLNAEIKWKGRDLGKIPISILNGGKVIRQNWTPLGTSP
jgi:hypothetical protein